MLAIKEYELGYRKVGNSVFGTPRVSPGVLGHDPPADLRHRRERSLPEPADLQPEAC
jgi:hypothetical protein